MAASDLRQVILTSHRNKRLRRSLPRLDAQITSQTLRLQVLLCYACLFVHFDGSDHSPDAQIAPWTLKSLPGRPNHFPDPQITGLAMPCLLVCSFRWLRSPSRCSDRSLDVKSFPGHSNHLPDPQITSLAMLCLFISMPQITPQMLRSLPGRSNHFLNAQINPQTLRLQVLLCLLVHFDGSDHSPDAQIASWTLKSLPGRSIGSQTLRLQVLLCLLVHFDCSDHSPNAP